MDFKFGEASKEILPPSCVMSFLQKRAADVVLLPALHVRLAVHRDEFLVELLRLHLTQNNQRVHLPRALPNTIHPE